MQFDSREHVMLRATFCSHVLLRSIDTNQKTRLYYQNDEKLVAIARNEHGLYSDYATNFYCIDGIWQPDNLTEIVSVEKLKELVEQFNS